jgi:mannosyltransferase OCH1-like enzyme
MIESHQQEEKNVNNITIPLLIHGIWIDKKDDNKTYPLRYQKYIDSMKLHNPEFVHTVWTNATFKEEFFASGKYPQLKRYENFYNNDIGTAVEKADVVRIMILIAKGGVYGDLKTEGHHSLLPLLQNRIGVFANDEHMSGYFVGEPQVWNGFMAAIPNHPFLISALEYIFIQYTPDLSKTIVFYSTGPCILGQVAVKLKYLKHNPATKNYIPTELGKKEMFVDECLIMPFSDLKNRHCGPFHYVSQNFSQNGSGWAKQMLPQIALFGVRKYHQEIFVFFLLIMLILGVIIWRVNAKSCPPSSS